MALTDPACCNHKDRAGVAYYGKPYQFSLCLECLDRRLHLQEHEPLDEHGERMAQADERAREGRR